MTHNNTTNAPTAQPSRITLRNEVSDKQRFYEFIESLCERMGCPADFMMETQLALEEALVNVISYAHPGEPGQHDIELSCTMDGRQARFTIADDGIPFDPTQHKEVDVDAPIEQRAIGGLGIHMVRNLVDSMEYCRRDGLNMLTLCKSIPQA